MSWVLSRLSRAGERFFGFIKRAVERGLSYFRFRRVAEEAGVPPQQIPTSSDYELVSKWDRIEQVFRSVPRDSIIPEDLYLPVERIRGGRFVTTFRVRGINFLTGEVEEKYVSIVHDNLMRRDILESKVADLFRYGVFEGSPQFEIHEIEPVRGFRLRGG